MTTPLNNTSISRVLSRPELKKLLSSSKWSLKTLFQGDIPSVDKTIGSKLLQMSALKHDQISTEKEQDIVKSLQQQMKFINHLYDNESALRNEKSNNKDKLYKNFRLMYTDHQPNKPLQLTDIMDQINQLNPSECKGETSNWKVTINSKSNINNDGNNNDYFTIKTSIDK